MSCILIIEDDPDLAELMAITLRSAGHAIELAADGGAALLALRTITPDAVILDIMLPDIVGFSLCETLRRRPATARLPILCVSACEEAEARPIALASGADDFLAKPFSPHQLVARVRKMITGRHRRAA